MRYFKITLAYDGTRYAGWQIQDDADTIQGRLESALGKILAQPVRVIGSGRTDAGVHASGQVASFRCETPRACPVLLRALNGNLPRDIVVLKVEEAAEGFHAIRDCVSKRYRYVIHDGGFRDVFALRYAWQLPRELDDGDMREAASCLLGRHDFSCFEAAGSRRATSVRTVSLLELRREAGEFSRRITVTIQADGFLYNMVRNIVGSLVEVGRGRRSPDWIAELLRGRDRAPAGPTAPAQGLFLESVVTR